MERSWIKMYNEEGSVLRIETLIASPLRPSHMVAALKLREVAYRSLYPTLREDLRETQRTYGERFLSSAPIADCRGYVPEAVELLK
jgi:hypothetical protein